MLVFICTKCIFNFLLNLLWNLECVKLKKNQSKIWYRIQNKNAERTWNYWVYFNKEPFLMRGLLTEPCMKENKVIKMPQEWCQLLSLYSGFVTGFSLLLKCMVSQVGKGIFFGSPWQSLFCTGCVCNRHLATCFHPIFFNHCCVLPTLILTFMA